MEPDEANPFARGSFRVPVPVVDQDPDTGALVYVCFNEAWQPYVVGALKQLVQQATWDTNDETTLNLVQARAMTLLDLFQGTCVVIGQVVAYAGTTAPAGWLLCDGSAVSRTTYAALFAVVGTTYGPGDGSTTFNLPDLRSRVPLGAGTGSGLSTYALGATTGEETHTLVTSETPSHSHTDVGHTHVEGIAAPAIGAAIVGVPIPSAVPAVGVTGVGTASLTSTGGGGAHNNIQPILALNFIIKT